MTPPVVIQRSAWSRSPGLSAPRACNGFGTASQRVRPSGVYGTFPSGGSMMAGADDLVFDELETYFAGPGLWSVEGLSGRPDIRPIRDDPRFATLVAKYGRR
jgi:hypothetical protein